MATTANSHTVVKEHPRRRRFAGVLGTLSLGVALVAGATTAAFTDSEYANLFNASGGAHTGFYNIQIREKAADAWAETSLDGKADNLPDEDKFPLKLNISNTELVPGDPTKNITAKFSVRNDERSTMATSLHLKLTKSVETGKATDQELVTAMMFDVTVGTGAKQTLSYDAMQKTPVLIAAKADPKESFDVQIVAYLPASVKGTDAAKIMGKKAFLVAQVDGSSVA
ncbi:MAG: hypothetical protein LBJ02_07755 [Bifidobacteriaceae bacterium]|jgi:predicted ribosomally synthesized peptide with SipW-like signal peptide|nr:hypothetical protein [Bifidobacteriaceae bacterium]